MSEMPRTIWCFPIDSEKHITPTSQIGATKKHGYGRSEQYTHTATLIEELEYILGDELGYCEIAVQDIIERLTS